jgi:hypothetical protein
MKHLLTGVAMAAALAIAAPVWAQTAAPMTPSSPPKAAPAAPKPAAATTTAKKPMKHMAMRHKGSGDAMTEQLNQQELARIMGGGAPAPAPMPSPTPGGQNPTSGTAGPFYPK